MPKRAIDRLESVNLLDVVPCRVAEWEEAEGLVVLHRPAPSRRGLRALVDWALYAMAVRRIRLDEVGSFAWHQLDGVRTVGEVAQLLRHQFAARIEPAEERLGRLIRMLREERLVAYREWDPEADVNP